ncbi:MAG: prolyl aminopeptidase [Tatlockia sp.]|jgi:proline iminopeptidase
MHPLYPAIKPYRCHTLAVGKTHLLHIEETGNPGGIPVIALHQGPGAGGNPHLRRFFDPELYRIVLFDQRGSGQSTPHFALEENTTAHLIQDIDAIAAFLNLPSFILFGGGWGALLALLYAQAHPETVSTLLLYQIFLGRKKEVDWFYKQGTNLFYPDYWQEFIDFVPLKKRQHVLQYYTDCLQGNYDILRMGAAKNWALWQLRCSSLQPHPAVIEQYNDPHFALSLAILESYYLKNHYFIEENQVLSHIEKIQHIPTFLIHGRQDMISPLDSAYTLHQALPHSHLRIVEAGHSEQEPGLIDAIVDISKALSHQGLDVS